MRIPLMLFVVHGEKPKKFNELNLKRWQLKMLLYLTTLKLAESLTEEAQKLLDDEFDLTTVAVVNAWKMILCVRITS